MMNKLRWPLGACGCLILRSLRLQLSRGQATEVDYKALYAAAEYDKALEVVASLDSTRGTTVQGALPARARTQAEASTAIECARRSPHQPSSPRPRTRHHGSSSSSRRSDRRLLPTIARRVVSPKGASSPTKSRMKRPSDASRSCSRCSPTRRSTDANAKQDLETLATGFIDLANAAATPVQAVRRRRPQRRFTTTSAPGATRTRGDGPTALSCRRFRRCRLDIAGRVGAKLVHGGADRRDGQGHSGNGEGVSAPAL